MTPKGVNFLCSAVIVSQTLLRGSVYFGSHHFGEKQAWQVWAIKPAVSGL